MRKYDFLQKVLYFHRVYRAISRSALFDREYYLQNNRDVARACKNPVKHYLRDGWKQGKNPTPYFNTTWYLQTYPDVAQSGINPLYHYLCFGWKQGYDPCPTFSTHDYLRQYPAVAQSGHEPLSHFLRESKENLDVADLSKSTNDMGNFGCLRKVAIHAHVYYVDLVGEFIEYMNHVPVPYDCFFTTDTAQKEHIIREAVEGELNAQKVEVRRCPNRGRDIAPFVVTCRDVLAEYDLVCHIHTKKALHTVENDYGNIWRKNIMMHLLGSQQQVWAILNYFSDNPNVGLLCPRNFIPIQKYLESDINQWNIEYLAKRMELKTGPPRKIVCPAGSMFWARTRALRNLVDAEFAFSEFDGEEGQLDGTLAHAFERLFVYIGKDNGFTSGVIPCREISETINEV